MPEVDVPRGPAEPCSQQSGEPDDAWHLFEAYVALPPAARNLARLAAATGYAYGTVANYSARWRWSERAAECDGVDELRVAMEKRRVRRLLLDRAADLDEYAKTPEVLKIAGALAKLAPETRTVRHPQPRDGGGRFAPDGKRLAAVPGQQRPECECANPVCRAPLAGCEGGFCPACSSAGAAAS